ncbi:hypothetical protein PanWU01x14_308880, partial [Parasponia andersonii]
KVRALVVKMSTELGIFKRLIFRYLAMKQGGDGQREIVSGWRWWQTSTSVLEIYGGSKASFSRGYV